VIKRLEKGEEQIHRSPKKNNSELAQVTATEHFEASVLKQAAEAMYSPLETKASINYP
jgi:hypothetical protein